MSKFQIIPDIRGIGGGSIEVGGEIYKSGEGRGVVHIRRNCSLSEIPQCPFECDFRCSAVNYNQIGTLDPVVFTNGVVCANSPRGKEILRGLLRS